MRSSVWRGVDWEARLWDVTQKIACSMAANQRGVVPKDDAAAAVCFGRWVVQEYMDAVDPPRKTEEVIKELMG